MYTSSYEKDVRLFMSTYQPWVGTCHFRQGSGHSATPSDQKAMVAVWTANREDYESALRRALEKTGGGLIWAEDALPVTEWLARHGHNANAMELARTVHQGHPVAFGAATGIAGAETAEDNYLIIEEIEGVEPLGSQFGVADKRTVPDALYEPLFGQPAPTEEEIAQYGTAKAVPPMRTYAILDAAKIQFLPELLAASKLNHKCLFKGRALDDLGDVAPWIVELEDGNAFTRSLFTKSDNPKTPSAHWDKEAGIFARSRVSLEEIWRHFRKFTKIQDENEKWYYFRFWDTKALFHKYQKFGFDRSSVMKLLHPACFLIVASPSLKYKAYFVNDYMLHA